MGSAVLAGRGFATAGVLPRQGLVAVMAALEVVVGATMGASVRYAGYAPSHLMVFPHGNCDETKPGRTLLPRASDDY